MSDTLNTFFGKEIISKEKLDKLYGDDYTTTVYPSRYTIFNPFSGIKLQDVKVVILGESPYKIGSNGLAFSNSVNLPRSLANIFLEMKNDIGIQNKTSDLTDWKYQGVLLLNTIPTLDSKNRNTMIHESFWGPITNKIIHELSNQSDFIVFVLWGNKAISKSCFIDKKKHRVLSCSHPSPHSANISFFGCKHFSRINQLLESKKKEKINWKLE